MAVYACADLHGQDAAWGKIKNILKPDDTLYFLGDAIDRGPDGVKIMLELLTRPNTIYLMGNHEDMMINALKDNHSYLIAHWYNNGGRLTHEALQELDDDIFNILISCITFLPLTAEYVNTSGKVIHMSHAGFNIGTNPNKDDLLWDRNHFITDYWDIEEHPNDYIIHGHTPVEYLEEERSDMALMLGLNTEIKHTSCGSCAYDHGHKIDIDCGVHFTNHTVLFNLDTFEEIIIWTDGNTFVNDSI